MLVNAIIAEYNPFHNGHKYQLDTCKAQTGADYTIVVMSGDFTQRGAPALLPKHERARMALSAGADLVLELPLYYACGSAEYFANGAVSLLDKLGVVNFLSFGSENGDVKKLTEIAELLQNEPPAYREVLKQALKKGMTYPQARREALLSCFPRPASLADRADGSCTDTADDSYPDTAESSLQAALDALLSAPNNILGIEYCRALLMRKSTITPFTIQRLGAAYHASSLSQSELNASALAIRTALSGKNTLSDADDTESAPLVLCRDMLPPASYVNLDEYKGLPGTHDQSYRYFMNTNLFDHVDIDKANTNVPDGLAADPAAECARYDALVASLGYADLQLLGLGNNGHIGFNEPCGCFVKETHVVDLTESTIDANARFFESASDVPRQALTMGIGCIMAARRVLLIASGEAKADAVYKMVCGPITPECPASILQLHNDVVLVADKAALSKVVAAGVPVCG